MNNEQEFVTRTVIDFVNLNNVIRKQECQIEVMKLKNHELEKLISFLKGKIIEYDPSMKQELDLLMV